MKTASNVAVTLVLAITLGACASAREAASPESPTASSPALAYGAADASAPPAEKSVEAAPAPGVKKEEPKPDRPIEEADPARALADAEKLLDQTLGGRATGLRNDGAPPAKETPNADSCSIACRALASMRRSADRLCELAPSASPDAPRCDEAKDRVTKAERRVRERCPSCAATP